VVIDVGCGFNPELSQYLIKKFGLTAFAVDPTKKHAAALGELANRYAPRFIHLPYAVTNEDNTIEFFETIDFESGSTLMDHCYVSKGRLRKYEVQSRNISSLVKELKLETVDLMKLDLEGAEYELIANMRPEDLTSIRQLFIEFHHHAFKRIKRKDTRKAVSIIKSFGFKAFTLDSNNYLFYRM
jgi:FkbM family methyltransferase